MEVIFGKDGVVRHAKKGTVFVDMSTIGPTAAKKIGTKLERIGMHFLDAPVTGGTYGAESGKLTIFVGGNEQIFQKLRPVFSSMGDNIHYMGETGSGQAIKMINNFLIASSLVSLSEGMLLSDAMGLPRKKLAQALATTPAVSLAMNRKLPNYVVNEFPMNFTIRNMKKDLTLAVKEAKNKKHSRVLRFVASLYSSADVNGLSHLDYSQIIDEITRIS